MLAVAYHDFDNVVSLLHSCPAHHSEAIHKKYCHRSTILFLLVVFGMCSCCFVGTVVWLPLPHLLSLFFCVQSVHKPVQLQSLNFS